MQAGKRFQQMYMGALRSQKDSGKLLLHPVLRSVSEDHSDFRSVSDMQPAERSEDRSASVFPVQSQLRIQP